MHAKFSDQLPRILRMRLLDYATRVGIEFRKAGVRWIARCPFHDDRRPSFALFIDRTGSPRIICTCGWSGDVFDLAVKLGKASSFPDAVRHIAEILGMAPDAGGADHGRKLKVGRTVTPSRMPDTPELPADFEARHRAARARLWSSPEKLRKAGAELAVTPEIVRSLCYTSDALGWANDRLLYLYPHGAKLRNPSGERPRFRWLMGRAVAPWRWHFAARPNVSRVFVAEGESDCIAAIADGLEDLYPADGSPGSAVVAIPGVAFPEEWSPIFAGKDVVLMFDNDPAGRAATARVGGLIAGHARSVKSIRWEGTP